MADKIVELLQQSGIEVLKNSQKEFQGLNFIGFDDYWGLNFNPDKVMNNLSSDKSNIVLCHNQMFVI